MRRFDPVFGALIATATFLGAASAFASGITVLGQDRRVSGSTFATTPLDFDSDVQEFVAPDGGPFEASAVVHAAVDGATGSASGSQISVVMPYAIEASGAYDASAEVTVQNGTAYASCQSNVALRFVVPEATTYVLQGFLEAANDGVATFQLSRPFLTVEWFSAADEHLDLNETGVIDAGTYDVNVTASGTAAADVGVPAQVSGAYDIHVVFGSGTDAPVVASRRVAAYPNPFTSETRLVLPEGASRIRIFDLAGRAVRTLEGSASLTWDGRDDAGRALAGGVYWVRADDVSGAPLKVVRVR
jgi:hypothetical protein